MTDNDEFFIVEDPITIMLARANSVEHSGVKGMRWGVRRDAVTSGKFGTRINIHGSPNVKTKRAAKAFVKDSHRLIEVHKNLVALARHEILKSDSEAHKVDGSSKYKGIDFKTDRTHYVQYNKDMVAAMNKTLKRVDPEKGSSKSIFVHKYTYVPRDDDIILTTTPRSELNHSVDNAATSTFSLTRNSRGHIIGMTPKSEIEHSDMTVKPSVSAKSINGFVKNKKKKAELKSTIADLNPDKMGKDLFTKLKKKHGKMVMPVPKKK